MTYSEHSEKSEEELAAAVYVNDKLKCLIVSLLQGALSGLLNTLKVWNLMVQAELAYLISFSVVNLNVYFDIEPTHFYHFFHIGL